ncbi:MAG: TIR domain-containing protein [Spirulina sp.]
MGDDALDILLGGARQERRSRPAGLRVSDILTMPPDQQALLHWLIRNYEATPDALADQLGQTLDQMQPCLDDLQGQGYLYTLDRNGSTYYRVKLAPKTGRQMPTDVWQVLDRDSEQANVFISYSRRNKEFVQQLHSALEATGREVWVDWESIPVAGDWWQEIQLGIELADTFLFVISPDSAASKVCGQEIEEALKHNKRLVPVVYEDVLPDQIHPELARLNWIFLRPEDDFQTGFQRLLAALDQDLDYVRAHTRLLVRALDWERHGRDHSYLLRGADLDRANEHLAQGNNQEPRPTALHHRYVLASAEAEAALREGELERQTAVMAEQRRWLRVVTAISVVAVGVGVVSGTLLHRAKQAQAQAELGQWQSLHRLTQVLGQVDLQTPPESAQRDRQFELLLTATQAGQVFQQLPQAMQTPERQAQTYRALQQALAALEGNTLDDDGDPSEADLSALLQSSCTWLSDHRSTLAVPQNDPLWPCP